MTPNYLIGSKDVGGKAKSIPDYLKGSKTLDIESAPKKKSFGQEFKEFFTSPEENPFEQGLGTAVRGVSSAILGAPGNINELSRSAAEGTVNFVSSLLGGPQIENQERTRILPTTSDVEKGFDVATEGKYVPTEETKPYYETGQDIASMFLPGSGALKAWQKIAIPIVGQLSKQGIKALGGSEKSQELGKLGFMLGMSIAGTANGEKYASNLLQQSESLLTPGTMIDALPTSNVINRLKNSTWFRGADTPSTRPAKQLIEAIEKNISGGQMEGQMAVQLRKNANEIQKNLGAFDVVSKSDKKKAILHLNEAKEAVMKGLDHYGKTRDPIFWKLNQEANMAYATIAKSQVLKRAIEKYAPSLKSNAAKALFGGGSLAGAGTLITKAPLAAAGSLGGAAATAGALKTGQILYRVMANPKLREYYSNVIKYAAKDNSKAIVLNLQRLDEALMKQEDQIQE